MFLWRGCLVREELTGVDNICTLLAAFLTASLSVVFSGWLWARDQLLLPLPTGAISLHFVECTHPITPECRASGQLAKTHDDLAPARKDHPDPENI